MVRVELLGVECLCTEFPSMLLPLQVHFLEIAGASTMSMQSRLLIKSHRAGKPTCFVETAEAIAEELSSRAGNPKP